MIDSLLREKVHHLKFTSAKPDYIHTLRFRARLDFLQFFLPGFQSTETIQIERIQFKLGSHSRGSKKRDDTFSDRGSRGCCGTDGESCRSGASWCWRRWQHQQQHCEEAVSTGKLRMFQIQSEGAVARKLGLMRCGMERAGGTRQIHTQGQHLYAKRIVRYHSFLGTST